MNKPKFLFVSYAGLCADLAWHILKDGHETRLFIENEGERDIGDGFVPKSVDWEADAEWADIIVFDDVLGHGMRAQRLRQKGKKVVGGTPFTDRLEDDRAFGQEQLKRVGVNIIPYQEFNRFDEAIEFVRRHPARYVIKPSGEAQNIKRLLFVGEEEDGKDVIQVLEAYQRACQDTIQTFQLQKRVQGVEVAVGAFFNGREFCTPVNINFEHKKFFPGNIGPSTGEMGTAMYWSGPNKIFRSTLQKMEGILREEAYVGYIDLNCIVNSNGIYPLEFTARLGYPTIHIQLEGLGMPVGQFFAQLAEGSLKTFKTKKGFQVGVRVVVAPYPFNDNVTFETHSKNSAILFKKPMREGVHIEEVKIINDQWVVAGNAGVVLVVVGTGTTMIQARHQAYSRINQIMIPGMYYRKDIGERWFEDCDRLHTWGYLRES